MVTLIKGALLKCHPQQYESEDVKQKLIGLWLSSKEKLIPLICSLNMEDVHLTFLGKTLHILEKLNNVSSMA